MKTNCILVMAACVFLIGSVNGQLNVTTTRPRRVFNVSDDALLEISSQLYALDVNGAYGRLELDLQNRTNSGNTTDKASRPLFKNGIPADILSLPTYTTLLAMYDNYIANANETEVVTNQELAEEVSFLDAVMETKVMKAAHKFLVAQGLADARVPRFRDYLRTIWFGLYQRSPGKKGSSGFEHIFLGEWKNGISGLHSWIRYQLEESRGNMNYMGYIRTVPIGRSPVGVIEMPMKWQGVYKPVSSITVASSPEMEMAIYTICFLTRPDALCPIQGPIATASSTSTSNNNRRNNGTNSAVRSGSTSNSRPIRNNNRFKIQTFTSTFQGRRYVGSAYPII